MLRRRLLKARQTLTIDDDGGDSLRGDEGGNDSPVGRKRIAYSLRLKVLLLFAGPSVY